MTTNILTKYNDLPEVHKVHLPEEDFYTVCCRLDKKYLVVITKGRFTNQGLYVSVKEVTEENPKISPVWKDVVNNETLVYIKTLIQLKLDTTVSYITGTE